MTKAKTYHSGASEERNKILKFVNAEIRKYRAEEFCDHGSNALTKVRKFIEGRVKRYKSRKGGL